MSEDEMEARNAARQAAYDTAEQAQALSGTNAGQAFEKILKLVEAMKASEDWDEFYLLAVKLAAVGERLTWIAIQGKKKFGGPNGNKE